MILIKDLMDSIPQTGKIEWIGIRPHKKAELISKIKCDVSVEDGLHGDHYQGRSKKRQVTLIQWEYLDVVSSILGKEVSPEMLRRNIVVSGINLNALKDRKIKIGESVVLLVTGACHPCTRMEKNLGPGGYNAMRGHGGLTATLILGGSIQVGDRIKLIK